MYPTLNEYYLTYRILPHLILAYGCAVGEFECMNLGQCVSAPERCDGEPQCDDASDEDPIWAGCLGKQLQLTAEIRIQFQIPSCTSKWDVIYMRQRKGSLLFPSNGSGPSRPRTITRNNVESLSS